MRHSYADNVFLLGLTFLLGWRREDYFNIGKLLAGAEAKTSQKQPKSVICPPVISGTNSLKLPALQLRKIDLLQMTAWSPHAATDCLAAARFSIGEVPVAPVAPVARTVTRTSQTMRRILITMRGKSCACDARKKRRVLYYHHTFGRWIHQSSRPLSKVVWL